MYHGCLKEHDWELPVRSWLGVKGTFGCITAPRTHLSWAQSNPRVGERPAHTTMTKLPPIIPLGTKTHTYGEIVAVDCVDGERMYYSIADDGGTARIDEETMRALVDDPEADREYNEGLDREADEQEALDNAQQA